MGKSINPMEVWPAGASGSEAQNTFVSGSIPARAGEPPTSSTFFRGDGVYPRACGGTSNFKHVLPRRWGLSPRVRGNLQNFAFAGTRSRFRLSPQ